MSLTLPQTKNSIRRFQVRREEYEESILLEAYIVDERRRSKEKLH